jgi:hypothetical protein
LNLLTTNRRELSPDAWLQFDEKNQEFVGIPLEEEVGREEYQLVCSDANGKFFKFFENYALKDFLKFSNSALLFLSFNTIL